MKMIYKLLAFACMLLMVTSPVASQTDATELPSFSIAEQFTQVDNGRAVPINIGDGALSRIWTYVPDTGIHEIGNLASVRSVHSEDAIFFLIEQTSSFDYIALEWYFNATTLNSTDSFVENSDVWIFGSKPINSIQGDAKVVDDNGTILVEKDEIDNIYWEKISPNDEEGPLSSIELERSLTTLDTEGMDIDFTDSDIDFILGVFIYRSGSIIGSSLLDLSFSTEEVEVVTIDDSAAGVSTPLYIFNQIARASTVGAFMYSIVIMLSRYLYKKQLKEATE